VAVCQDLASRLVSSPPHQIPLPTLKDAVLGLIEAKTLFFSLLQRLIGFF
jgi:hypothetical protein